MWSAGQKQGLGLVGWALIACPAPFPPSAPLFSPLVKTWTLDCWEVGWVLIACPVPDASSFNCPLSYWPMAILTPHPPSLQGPIGITQKQPSWFDFGRIGGKFPNSTNDLIRNIIVLHKYWTNDIFVVVCPSGIEIGLGPNWPFPGAVQCDLFSITPPPHSTEMNKEENDSKTLKFNRTL